MFRGERAEQSSPLALVPGAWYCSWVLVVIQKVGSSKSMVQNHLVKQILVPPPCSSASKHRKKRGIAAFIDAEHALDPSYAAELSSQ